MNKAIDSLKSLKPNWDSYGGDPPTAEAIAKSKAIVARLDEIGFMPDGIYPTPYGGVDMEFEKGDRSVDIEVLSNGDVELCTWTLSGDEPARIITVHSLVDVFRHVPQLQRFIAGKS